MNRAVFEKVLYLIQKSYREEKATMKKLLMILTSIFFIFGASACANGTDQTEDADTETTPGETADEA